MQMEPLQPKQVLPMENTGALGTDSGVVVERKQRLVVITQRTLVTFGLAGLINKRGDGSANLCLFMIFKHYTL